MYHRRACRSEERRSTKETARLRRRRRRPGCQDHRLPRSRAGGVAGQPAPGFHRNNWEWLRRRYGRSRFDIRGAVDDKCPAVARNRGTQQRVSPVMDNKRFSHAIHVRFKQFGQGRTVTDAHEALDCLMYCWPAKRGPRHRDALDACLKVIEGHRSTIDAEKAFTEAAREADILEKGQPHR